MIINNKIILDTDIGYDPDDLFALLFLHKLVGSDLELIITADEVEGKRARFVAMVLKMLKNTHTKVVQGSSLHLKNFIIDELIENDSKNDVVTDYLTAMKSVADENEKIIYIGIGGFTNLAHFITTYPDYRDKLTIFLMGGAINYERNTGWIEHNIRIDISSAKKVIESGWDITLVMAQTTHNPMYEIDRHHVLFQKLSASADPIHKILAKHCTLWYEMKGFTTTMHDPLTVSVALAHDFVSLNESNVIVENGVISINENGHPIKWTSPESKSFDFMELLEKTLFD